MVFGFWKKSPVDFTAGEEVEVSLTTEQGTPEVFISSVSSQEKKSFSVLLPVTGRNYTLKTGMSITVHFRREGHLGSFQSQILELKGDESPPYIVLSAPSQVFWEEIDPARLPLRDFPRIELQIPLEGKYHSEDFEGITTNLSGSGLAFLCDRSFPEESILDICLLFRDKEIFLSGKVSRSIKTRADERKKNQARFEVAVNFTEISPDDQNRILRFLLEKQKEVQETESVNT